MWHSYLLILLISVFLQPKEPPRLIVLGDSIGVGVGASDPAHGYAAILASRLGMPLDNRSIGGSTIDQQLIPTDLRHGDIVVWLSGYNDMRAGHDPSVYGAKLRTAVAAMEAQGATVYVGLCLPMTAAGYAAYGPQWNHGSDALVANYQAQFPGVRIDYDPANGTTDLIHPNDAGHAQIAASLLAAMSTAPPIARWDGIHAATIEWAQTARGCLWQLPSAFVGCYDGDRRVRVGIGRHAPVSGDLRPYAGVVYRVVIDGTPYDVPLRSVLYFPVFR